jgi:hypothetical protein
VVQDVRGKFSSDGVFEPMVNEKNDGFDTVEWISRQPWCNGRVGMWGESYYGLASLAAAIAAPPALACIAPGDIVLDWHKIFFRQGAFYQNTLAAWTISMDANEYADLSKLDSWHLPLIEQAKAAGQEGKYFKAVIEHSADLSWWKPLDLSAGLDRIAIPVLYWSGWYDNYTGGLLGDYARLKQKSPHPDLIHLMVGPWDHEGSSEHTDHAICIPLPSTAAHRWDSYQAFFDRYLMEIENDFGKDGGVDYFTIAADRWQKSHAWPPVNMTPTPFYLRTGERLSSEAPSGDEAPDRFRYDPAKPVAETVGLNCWALCAQLGDRSEIEKRADVLCYTTAPLEADLELTGPIKAVLSAASSAPDTDFTVALIDLFPDGTANQIQDGIVRTSCARDPYRPEPVPAGEIRDYEIDLFATSYLVKAGHSIRVDVSSSCFDRYDRNTNTGELFGTARLVKIAEQAIHHSAAHPSRIVLPVVRR